MYKEENLVRIAKRENNKKRNYLVKAEYRVCVSRNAKTN